MNYRTELIETIGKIDDAQFNALLDFVRNCTGTLWLAGNGGSASTAQHWACDLSKAAGRRVQALGSNPAVLTAYANDHNYRTALARELRSVARPDDALLCFSCSGTSENLWGAFHYARAEKMPCALLTSKLAPDNLSGILAIRVPHTHYGIIEDCHLAIGHWLVEELRRGAAQMTRALFLDRDGTITQRAHYPNTIDDLTIIDGVPDALRPDRKSVV